MQASTFVVADDATGTQAGVGFCDLGARHVESQRATFEDMAPVEQRLVAASATTQREMSGAPARVPDFYTWQEQCEGALRAYRAAAASLAQSNVSSATGELGVLASLAADDASLPVDVVQLERKEFVIVARATKAVHLPDTSGSGSPARRALHASEGIWPLQQLVGAAKPTQDLDERAGRLLLARGGRGGRGAAAAAKGRSFESAIQRTVVGDQGWTTDDVAVASEPIAGRTLPARYVGGTNHLMGGLLMHQVCVLRIVRHGIRDKILIMNVCRAFSARDTLTQ